MKERWPKWCSQIRHKKYSSHLSTCHVAPTLGLRDLHLAVNFLLYFIRSICISVSTLRNPSFKIESSSDGCIEMDPSVPQHHLRYQGRVLVVYRKQAQHPLLSIEIQPG